MAFGKGGKAKKAKNIPATKQARRELNARWNRKKRPRSDIGHQEDAPVVAAAAVDDSVDKNPTSDIEEQGDALVVAAAVVDSMDETSDIEQENASVTGVVASKRLTRAQLEASGIQTCSQEERRIYCVVAYRKRFNCPPEEEWAEAAKLVANEIGMKVRSVKVVFQRCLDGDQHPARQREGKGRPPKLAADNPGLRAAARVLHSGQSVAMATKLCNEQNESLGVRITKNTLVRTLKSLTATDVLERDYGTNDGVAVAGVAAAPEDGA
jgi:hypothetical protein